MLQPICLNTGQTKNFKISASVQSTSENLKSYNIMKKSTNISVVTEKFRLKGTSRGHLAQPPFQAMLTSKLHHATLGLIQSSWVKSWRVETALTNPVIRALVKSLQALHTVSTAGTCICKLVYYKLNRFPVTYFRMFFCSVRVRRWKQIPSLQAEKPLVTPYSNTPPTHKF